MNLYYVNPADTTDISATLRAGSPHPERSYNVQGPNPADDIYEAIEAGAPPNIYYTRGTVFEGAVRDDAARVRESNDPVPMDVLLEQKRAELNAYTAQVFFAAFPHTQGPLEFWAANSDVVQLTRLSYIAYLGMHGLDILYDAVETGAGTAGGVNAEIAAFWNELKQQSYWTRDIRVFLYDKSTLLLVRDAANRNQWKDLMESYGTHSWQVRNAADRVESDFATAYNGGTGTPGGAEWQQLAAIDVADPIYNWPEHYTGSFAAGFTTIAQMLSR